MLFYPKIPTLARAPLSMCYAFEKYDGTNFHWDWDPEVGWKSFGTRRDQFMLDAQGRAEFALVHPGLEEAPMIFLETLAKPLSELFQSHPEYQDQAIFAYAEFLGLNSFAGEHQAGDPKRLVLFDVELPSGFVDPARFCEDFSDLSAARLVYQGKLTGKFTDDVRSGKFDLSEGVVCKGGSGASQWCVKIKTNAYLAKLEHLAKTRR